jgi:hypothetical protein
MLERIHVAPGDRDFDQDGIAFEEFVVHSLPLTMS